MNNSSCTVPACPSRLPRCINQWLHNHICLQNRALHCTTNEDGIPMVHRNISHHSMGPLTTVVLAASGSSSIMASTPMYLREISAITSAQLGHREDCPAASIKRDNFLICTQYCIAEDPPRSESMKQHSFSARHFRIARSYTLTRGGLAQG